MTEDHEHEAEPLEQDITSTADDLVLGEGSRKPESEAESARSSEIEEARTEDEGDFEDEEDEFEDEEDEEEEDEEEPESAARPRPTPKLERLQKILAQAGIASRRHAEELITGGRVQVNGQVVTTLGSKADPTQDHIRVDGKLLHGAERLRYFMLNKPRGYVTTVTDPEGRPTVMEFFAKMGERLYPVGRLDYLSEGLLLITNDGELANSLTKAASAVEKIYLVKVSGRPDEEQLERLRGGISIERGKPGDGKVRTAPARIRQIRQGDNPWYEVALIEGRNRELRKMFEEIGHHVEKIRRVGYGPLVLDLEPGKLRELDLGEVAALRLAAEGKLKSRRLKTSGMLPREAGRSAEARERGFRPDTRGAKAGSPQTGLRPQGERPFKRDDRPPQSTRGAEDRGGARRGGLAPRRPDRETERSQGRPFRRESGSARPYGERPGPPSGRFAARSGGQRPYRSGPPAQETPRFERPARPDQARRREEGFRGEEPRKPIRPRGEGSFRGEAPRKPFRPRGERQNFERSEKPGSGFGERAPSTGRDFKRGGGQTGGRNFEKPASRERERPPRREGEAPAWRGKGRPAPEGRDRPSTGDRSRPAYGSKPPRTGARTGERSGGYSRPRSGQAGGRPAAGGKRGGGKRPGGPPGGRRRG